MEAMFASSWRSPAAGVSLLSRLTWSSLSCMRSAAVFSSTRATRRVPGSGRCRRPGRAARPGRSARACSGLDGDGRDLVDDGEVALEVLPGEAGVGLAPVVVGDVAGGADLAGEEAVAERGVGDEADAQPAQQREQFGLGVAGPQRVLGLQRGERVDGVGAADCAGAGLGQADVADLAFGDQFGQGAGGLLDGGVRVDPVLVVQVDVVGAEPPEEALGCGADVGRLLSVTPGPPPEGDESELGGHHDLVAAALYGLSDEFLAVERAVGLGGVGCPGLRALARQRRPVGPRRPPVPRIDGCYFSAMPGSPLTGS
jgi:hypothetical protein